MRFVRYLPHWLSGTGARLQVTDFVPVMHPIRQWADTFPWAALVRAIEQSFNTRFPTQSPRGRRPVPLRVLLALELLKHELGGSDEESGQRLRTDFAVMYACGLREYQVNPAQAHFVLPETLCEFRRRMDEALMDELIAIQAATAMEEGLVSPAHLVIDTFPSEQGSQRVTDATTLYKAQKKRSNSSTTSPSSVARGRPSSRAKPETSRRNSQRSCVVLDEAVEDMGTFSSSWCDKRNNSSLHSVSRSKPLDSRPKSASHTPSP